MIVTKALCRWGRSRGRALQRPLRLLMNSARKDGCLRAGGPSKGKQRPVARSRPGSDWPAMSKTGLGRLALMLAAEQYQVEANVTW